MHYFQYHGSQLYCEEVPVRAIARNIGTPFYLYSRRTLERHYRVFDSAFSSVPHLICYAVKANSNLALLKIFADLGAGFDIVSGGELFRILEVDANPQKIIYAGVGKRTEEIDQALRTKILLFNVESAEELEIINERARRLKTRASISLRVNPNVDPRTHPYISTGLQRHKFGIDLKKSITLYEKAARLKNLDIVGVACHIGSQILQVAPFVDALGKVLDLLHMLEKRGIALKYLDIGGGLGITYDQEKPPAPSAYARAIIQKLKGSDYTLIIEPGRVIVGNAGVLVTKVLYNKTNDTKNFVIVDAGMNDLIRPSLYGSFHEIKLVQRRAGKMKTVDVVGPVCESADFFAKDRRLPSLGVGDLVAIMSAGAYGFTLSSNYNSRPRVPEVLVDRNKFQVIRKRETYKDLIRGESVVQVRR